MFNAIDLFCGCGGMSYGLEKAGINIVAGIDIWDKAVESYKNNFDHNAICADLRNLSPESASRLINVDTVDVIVGGPPCQGFSIAGKRDNNDPRNSLFIEFVKYINYFTPKVFIMENVIGLLSMKTSSNEKVIDIIMSHFDNYNCIIMKLYASDYGVPQNRRRVIIFGIRKDLNIHPTQPLFTVEKRVPVKTILLNKEEVDEKIFLSKKAIDGIRAKKEKSKKNGNGFGAQFLDFEKPSYTIPARYWKDGYDALVKYTDNEIRRLTPLELKRIQTFPDNYVLCGSKKEVIMQIGNAVACKFAEAIGLHIVKLLNQ